MNLETSNQVDLHINRQKQLDKASEYTNNFINNLPGDTAYQINKCPTCGSSESSTLFIKNGGEYAYCKKCRHIFLKKSLSTSFLLKFYSDYPTSSLEWHKNESDFYQRIYTSGLELIQSKVIKGSILDIGCSSGYFLAQASKFGFDSFGVEPNELEASYAISQGINIIGKTINDIPQNSKFDVITMWDVLEHIANPCMYIQSLRPFLNDGGCIFVQIPTCDSLAARVMRDKCNMFDGIEHLTLFSAYSLNICFEKSDFYPIKFKTVITDSFALKNYLSFEHDPYLPSHEGQEVPIDFGGIDFDAIELASLGYKIQACYSL